MLKIYGSQDRFTPFQDMEIDEKDIESFELINRKTYTRKNTFKKFLKTYYVNINGNRFQIAECSFILLKQVLRGKYKSSHRTETVYKNFSERKGTDWEYKMIK